MLRLALAFLLFSFGVAKAEDGFLPYKEDVALTGVIYYDGGSGRQAAALLKLDKPVAVGGSPEDYQNGTTYRNVKSIQITPHDEHVAARLRAFDKSHVNVRGWLSLQPYDEAHMDILLTATEVVPVTAKGTP